MSNYNVKQVIILRKDLNMRKGKMVAQGAHASMAVLLGEGSMQKDTGHNDGRYTIRMNEDMQEWLSSSYAKICLGVNSEDELLAIHKAAKRANLPCSLIQDAGFTEFNGVPTYTTVAIGPAQSADIDKITGLLKLL